MKKYIFLFSFLLSGYLSAAPIDNTSVINFVEQIKKSISSSFYEKENYKGKECLIKVTLSDDGRLISAVPDERNTKNDKPLCDIGIEIIKETKFPSPPENKKISNKNTFYIDFRP